MNNKIALQLFNHFHIVLQGNVDYSSLELSEIKTIVNDIKDNYSQFDLSLMTTKDSDLNRAIEVLTTCLSALDCDFNDLTYDEFFNQLDTITDNINTSVDDFCIDSLPCGEVRLIHENDVDQIWSDSLQEQIKDCYDLSALDELPSFIAVSIDWEQTVANAKVDGMGHHFSGYDGSEHYASPYYIFRTN